MRMRRKKHLAERMARLSNMTVMSGEQQTGHNGGEQRTLLEAVAGGFLPHLSPTPVLTASSGAASAVFFVEIGCGKGAFCRTLAERHPEATVIAFEREENVCTMAAEQAVHLPNLHFICGDALAMDNGQWTSPPTLFPVSPRCQLFINFPDPWHARRHAKRRLMHRDALAVYARVLRTCAAIGGQGELNPVASDQTKSAEADCLGASEAGSHLPARPARLAGDSTVGNPAAHGVLAFKTDNEPLFRFALAELDACGWRVLSQTDDLPCVEKGTEFISSATSHENIMTEYEQKFRALGMPIYALTATAAN